MRKIDSKYYTSDSVVSCWAACYFKEDLWEYYDSEVRISI